MVATELVARFGRSAHGFPLLPWPQPARSCWATIPTSTRRRQHSCLRSPDAVAAGGPAKPIPSPGCSGCCGEMLPSPPPLVALAAPTGKAAVRMQEALADAVGDVRPTSPARSSRCRPPRSTACWGWVPDSRNASRALARQPLAARRGGGRRGVHGERDADGTIAGGPAPPGRRALVGDPDQLAPVEAGAVLAAAHPGPAASLADAGPARAPPSGPVVRLRHNYRSVRMHSHPRRRGAVRGRRCRGCPRAPERPGVRHCRGDRPAGTGHRLRADGPAARQGHVEHAGSSWRSIACAAHTVAGRTGSPCGRARSRSGWPRSWTGSTLPNAAGRCS